MKRLLFLLIALLGLVMASPALAQSGEEESYWVHFDKVQAELKSQGILGPEGLYQSFQKAGDLTQGFERLLKKITIQFNEKTTPEKRDQLQAQLRKLEERAQPLLGVDYIYFAPGRIEAVTYVEPGFFVKLTKAGTPEGDFMHLAQSGYCIYHEGTFPWWKKPTDWVELTTNPKPPTKAEYKRAKATQLQWQLLAPRLMKGPFETYARANLDCIQEWMEWAEFNLF